MLVFGTVAKVWPARASIASCGGTTSGTNTWDKGSPYRRVKVAEVGQHLRELDALHLEAV